MLLLWTDRSTLSCGETCAKAQSGPESVCAGLNPLSLVQLYGLVRAIYLSPYSYT